MSPCGDLLTMSPVSDILGLSPIGYTPTPPPVIVRTPKELGHLVRDYRARRALTQAHLAALVGASRKWIIDLEAGKRTADLGLVLSTLNALGVDIDLKDRSKRAVRTHTIDIDAIVRSARRPRA